MSRWTFLLRPSWLVLAVVVLGFAYLSFTVLAPWQLKKNTTTSRQNDQLAHALTADAVPVTELLGHQDSAAPEAQWRLVSATGRYVPDKQVLVRLRVVGGAPAFEVLVPFVVDGGPTVLVNRGYVRPEQGSQVPPIPPAPAAEVSISARLRDSQEAPPDREPFSEHGVTQVYSIDTAQITTLTAVPLTGSYLQLVDNQPGGLGVIELPQADAGPFLSYGIQWIVFGIVAPIGLGYFVYAEVRARRAEREAVAREAAESGTTAADAPTLAMTVEEKLADRYGRRR